MRRLALVALLPLAVQPAAAEERPALFPSRDVAVTYRMLGQGGGPGGVQSLVMAWHAATRTMRTDIPGMGWMVADQRGGRAFMVMEQMRAVMELPADQAPGLQGPSARATFRREGPATVAGLPCTNWAVQDGADQGRVCVTDDGVMLRAEGAARGQRGGLEAVQVAYGPQDPARFARPQGYQTMQMPAGMPPGMAPGMGPGAGRPPGR